MKTTKLRIENWFRLAGDGANVGIGAYQSHRRLTIQVCDGDRVTRCGSRKMSDVVAKFPRADKKLTISQFLAMRDGVVDFVTGN